MCRLGEAGQLYNYVHLNVIIVVGTLKNVTKLTLFPVRSIVTHQEIRKQTDFTSVTVARRTYS